MANNTKPTDNWRLALRGSQELNGVIQENQKADHKIHAYGNRIKLSDGYDSNEDRFTVQALSTLKKFEASLGRAKVKETDAGRREITLSKEGRETHRYIPSTGAMQVRTDDGKWTNFTSEHHPISMNGLDSEIHQKVATAHSHGVVAAAAHLALSQLRGIHKEIFDGVTVPPPKSGVKLTAKEKEANAEARALARVQADREGLAGLNSYSNQNLGWDPGKQYGPDETQKHNTFIRQFLQADHRAGHLLGLPKDHQETIEGNAVLSDKHNRNFALMSRILASSFPGAHFDEDNNKWRHSVQVGPQRVDFNVDPYGRIRFANVVLASKIMQAEMNDGKKDTLLSYLRRLGQATRDSHLNRAITAVSSLRGVQGGS